MNIAILISGEVRTFVLKEQILFFKRLLVYLKQFYTNVDVFMILKIPNEVSEQNKLIQSNAGLNNFKRMCKVLEPKHLQCFYDFNPINEISKNRYNIQLKMVDMCINQALSYEKQHGFKYDTFFRIRPDSCFLLHELDIINKNNCSIYTSIKSDAFGNDQIFIINKYVLYIWWIRFVRPIINRPLDAPPEYRMYNGFKTYLVSTFQNWIIRKYDDVQNWDKLAHNKIQLNSEYTFKYLANYNKMLITMPHDKFITKIKKISNLMFDEYVLYV